MVYLVFDPKTKSVYALKTFQDEYLQEAEVGERFRKEAYVWINLERHPFIVRAYGLEEFDGRLYIALEYIAPNEEGLNSLDGYLERRPLELAQSLRWAIQFCFGMEYAYSKGVRCHRDVKPANILISENNIVKISDFGLAGALGISNLLSEIKLNIYRGHVGLSGQSLGGGGAGTPTHMPPEQFTDADSCDVRSDIYSFGVVLYQMATGGQIPFCAPLPRNNTRVEMLRFWKDMQRLHNESPLRIINSPLFPIIQHCLEKEPDKRYQTFRDLRGDLELLLRRETGEVIELPESAKTDAWECLNKGHSLFILGRYEEALSCYDTALKLDLSDTVIWFHRGECFNKLGYFDEAKRCFDKALEITPTNVEQWKMKGHILGCLSRYEEALSCYGRAMELDPMDPIAWQMKGISLFDLKRYTDAIQCFDKSLEFYWTNATTWCFKGHSLFELGRFDESIRCYDRALEHDPTYASAWHGEGNCHFSLGRYKEAISCFDKGLQANPYDTDILRKKGQSLHSLDCYKEAISCYDKVIEIEPRNAKCWAVKADALSRLNRYDEGIRCLERALEIDPQYAGAWYIKALYEERLDRKQDAIRSYRKLIALPSTQSTKIIEDARRRLRKLEGG